MSSLRRYIIRLERAARVVRYWTNAWARSARHGLQRRRTSQDAEQPTIQEPESLQRLANQTTEHLLAGIPALASQLRRDRRMLTITLEEVWGDAFDSYDAIAYASYEIGALLAAESSPNGISRPLVWETLLDLHARACRIAAEVGILQRTGFPSGAEARYRTLHEIAVIAAVLQNEDEVVAHRYRDFETVERYQDAMAYQEHAEALGRPLLTGDELELLKQAYDDVFDRWKDKSLTRPLGWAAQICSKPNPGIADLERHAGMGHLRPFYRLANHAIHSGPRASTIERTEIGGRPHRTPGATVFGDVAETGHGAIILLQQINVALVTEKSHDAADSDLVIVLTSLNQLVEQCGDAFGAAADRARDRGWFSHGPDGG